MPHGAAHLVVLGLHGLRVGNAVLSLGNLEELVFGRIDLYQLNPVAHTGQEHPSRFVAQQHVASISELAVNLVPEILWKQVTS